MDKRLSLSDNKSIILLAGVLVLIVSSAVGSSGWTDRLNTVSLIGLFSVIIGLLISRSLLPTLIAHLFSLIIGAGWSFWVVSRLLPEHFTWPMRWSNMMERINSWLTVAIEGGVSYDNLMFILQMSLIIWISGYLTIWFLFRSAKVWSAIIPGGTILLIIFHYAPNNLTRWVFTFLLLSLLLIIMFNLMEHERRWRANHVYFRADINYDFLREGFIFSLVVITLAWFAPAIDHDQAQKVFTVFDREWRTVQNEWNRLFASLNYKPDPYYYANTFGQSLTLGGPRQLTAKPIVMVDAPGGRYWRAAVYNEYSGLGWASNDEINFDFGRGRQPSALPFFRARVPFTQTYTFFQDGATVLYAMASPVRLDRSAIAKVSYVSPDQMDNNSGNPWAGKKQPWLEEVTYIESNRRLLAEEPYQIVSMISIATEEQLRSDSLTYPNWVKERYLQLPDGIPRRVFDLAEEITRDADNRYDKAQAIEEYLRENITYNEKIESPPSDRDKVDYILFDLKEAYCDYYATSMIVMLRSLGIPSRLAAGYARGELETLDNQKKVYVVQSKNAHSWVEVFFPTYGWIEFEPTAAQPVIARRSSANNDLVSDNRGFDRNPLEEEFDPLDRAEDVNLNEGEPLAPFYRIQLPFWGEVKASKGLIRTTVIGLVLLMIGLGGWSLYTHRQQMQPTEVPTVSAVYIAMLKLAAWAGVKKYPSQTAYEHARQVANTLPTVQPEVDLITAEFVRQNFSRFHQTTEEIKSQIAEAWNNVRPKFYRAIFEIRNPLNKIRLPFKW